MFTPKTAKIKNTSIRRARTFNSAGKENIIVCNRAYKPLALFNNLNSLLTLKTLRTLANYGPTLKNFNELP